MATIKQFLKEIRLDVANCPGPVMENAVLNALVAFCKESRFWIQVLDPVDIVAGTHTYNLVVPSAVQNARIHELYTISAHGEPLFPQTADQLDRDWPSIQQIGFIHNFLTSKPWREYSHAQPRLYHQPTRSTVRIVAIPTKSEVGGLLMTAALYPGSTSTTVDDEIFEEWRETIGWGAKARLMMMSKKDWSDANAATAYAAAFTQGTNDAKGQRMRDFARDNKQHHRARSYY
ncbi:MAG TPA: hypothetical protein ENJ24_01840 [Gammaproteobacteria bacterium]|nr:hypothetical protein [Gammaproteobacteria bacterium]